MSRGCRILGGAVIAAASLLLAGSACAEYSGAPEATSRGDPVAQFLAHHWADPMQPQGNPPASYSPLEASLDPKACGTCHAQQWNDWKTSLHSRTIGPGILWQFLMMTQSGADTCMRCHAPLAEQKALVARERGWKNAPAAPPPAYVPADLDRDGLVCAACHVRRHARFGPPPRAGQPAAAGAGRLPHGGFSAQPAFEDSRFCATCHQFAADGARLDGKLLENTFEEWRSSPAAARGESCQSCHMPDRRHLWRGIHDPQMTRRALRVSLHVRRIGAAVDARAELANVGAGHDFPTYIVPEVVATLELVEASGAVRSVLARREIGRKADLQLTREISDTRIAPGSRARLQSRFALPAAGARDAYVRLRVVVHPGAHYERLFRSLLERPDRIPEAALPLLREALAEAQSGSYELYRLKEPIPTR